MQGLLTALDALAPLNLPCVIAHCGAVDTPAVVEVSGILHSNSHYYRRLYCTFFMMRGDPADPLTAARSLRDYVCCIIMLHKHNDYRRLYGTTAGHNDRSPIAIYNSLLYHCANCLVIACGADVSTGVG